MFCRSLRVICKVERTCNYWYGRRQDNRKPSSYTTIVVSLSHGYGMDKFRKKAGKAV